MNVACHACTNLRCWHTSPRAAGELPQPSPDARSYHGAKTECFNPMIGRKSRIGRLGCRRLGHDVVPVVEITQPIYRRFIAARITIPGERKKIIPGKLFHNSEPNQFTNLAPARRQIKSPKSHGRRAQTTFVSGPKPKTDRTNARM
jgi:hypothetical protein